MCPLRDNPFVEFQGKSFSVFALNPQLKEAWVNDLKQVTSSQVNSAGWSYIYPTGAPISSRLDSRQTCKILHGVLQNL